VFSKPESECKMAVFYASGARKREGDERHGCGASSRLRRNRWFWVPFFQTSDVMWQA
jgi:hypothetical protein